MNDNVWTRQANLVQHVNNVDDNDDFHYKKARDFSYKGGNSGGKPHKDDIMYSGGGSSNARGNKTMTKQSFKS